MAQKNSLLRIPPHDSPVLDKDGKMTLEWYQAFNQMLLALGGRGSDRVVRSPEANGTAIPQPVAAATQTIPLTVDGVEYNFLAQ